MPYKTFFNWVFDGHSNSPIPRGDDIPDLTKYNSPINEVFLLKSVINVGKMNHYFNTYLNNIGIRYIDREELFHFFKQCIRDFKVKRRDIHFIRYQAKEQLFAKLRRKYPHLKGYEISLFCEMIDNCDQKDSIYRTFGIDKPEKKKLKKKKAKKKLSAKMFISQTFSLHEL